jgi:hypothetical protein
LKTIKYSFLFVLLLTIIHSCGEEETDYREPFTGSFKFHSTEFFWEYGYPMVYDTTTYDFTGTVRLFQEGDELSDLYTDPDSLNPDSTITIEFLEGRSITTMIDSDGKFVSRGGYHYHCSGGYINPDKVVFDLEGLGGLGSGWDYAVSGARQ